MTLSQLVQTGVWPHWLFTKSITAESGKISANRGVVLMERYSPFGECADQITSDSGENIGVEGFSPHLEGSGPLGSKWVSFPVELPGQVQNVSVRTRIKVHHSDVRFANDWIHLDGSLVGTKGSKSYLARAVLFMLCLKLVPNTQIPSHSVQSVVENYRSTRHKVMLCCVYCLANWM